MRTTILLFLNLYSCVLFSQITSEVATSSFNNSELAFSVGKIYMSGQLETGVIAQSLSYDVDVSVEEEISQYPLVYPNPARNKVTIIASELPEKLYLINSDSKSSFHLNHENGTINISHLPNGIYFIRVNDKTHIPIIKI